MKSSFTRRKFLKATTLATGTIIGGTVMARCSGNSESEKSRTETIPLFSGGNYKTSDGISGLLFSQIGYETGYPVRIVVRLPRKELMSSSAICKLLPSSSGSGFETSCKYWGEIWKSHWWVAEFSGIKDPGEWDIEIHSDGKCVFRDTGLKVKENILWDKTVGLAAIDMLERRVHFTKVGAGWQDAGTLWVESPAQSAMVIALTELIENCPKRFDEPLSNRIYKQITVGCDYLVMLQAKAYELGFPKGSMSHDLHGHEKDVLPNDAMKAVVALARAGRLLPDTFQDKKKKYTESAELAFKWLTNTAKPVGDSGLSRFQRGLSESAIIPKDEWQTRDLVTLSWASVELWKNNNKEAKATAIGLASQIMARQIPEEKSENGFYGHFLEYPGMTHSEKSWIHGIVNNTFGADIGGIYPNYLIPLIDMIKLWPDHPDVSKWKDSLQKFTYNYLIPACEKNPFYLVPQGIFGDEGPVWFCGTFHGTNAIYGFTAALALELEKLFNEPKLKDIAYGNLQWLAGLNGGITAENMKTGCVIFSADIPEGIALPASMMCGVGNRWAGTWFQTRGVICNGFSTGKQFVYDTAPIKANDGPDSLTDEDWIPHSAAWLTGLMRLKA
jgi:hypothetical protein